MKYLAFLLLLSFKVNAQEQNNTNYSTCGLSQQAIKLATLIIESNNQQRKELHCNSKLAELALVKAKLMAKTNKISHTIEHTTANQLLRNNGIKLPKNYGIFDNQVESIMGAVKTAQESFDVFMTSAGHKYHLLGEDEFLLSQNQIGVGFYKDESSEHVYHWVVYITEIITDE
jgi:uncharacterized protein YkwD